MIVVSIASQRRFLYYWSLLVLSPQDVPLHFWSNPPLPIQERPQVYLKEIRIRMREGGVARTALSFLNSALEVAGRGGEDERGKGDVWVSLARYQDAFVDVLEDWERRTRKSGEMEKRRTEDSSEGPILDSKKDGWDVGVHGIFADGAPQRAYDTRYIVLI